MSRFGWAYASSVLLSTGSVANGPTGSLQFHNSSQTLSGSPNLTYNVSSGQLVLTGTMIVSGTLYATEYHTNIVSSSIIYSSGSTKFGDDAGDTHQFTGSVLGDIVSGTIARFTTISGSNITGTFAGNGTSLTGLTASNISNFTSDVRGQFSAGTGIAINAGVISASNVPNSSLQNSSLAIGTTSISLGATGSTIQGLTTLTSSNVTGTTAQFTTISASLLSASSIAGYAIGTNVQAYDATLAAIAGASTAADTYIYFTATDTAAVGTVTSFARTLLDDTSNTTARTTLGLGTIATQDASSVAITGGSINNTTIGATTQNTGQFTTLSASSTIRAGGAITGSGISSSAELLVGSTSTFAGTATFNGNVVLGDTLSDVVTSNAQITASNGISGSTLQFTTISGSTITSSNFIGNGSSLANLTASNITNFTNDVRAQFTPGTNITIVGGVISSTGGGGTPGGADTQVQFNSGSTFSGSSNLTYNYTTSTLSGTTAQFTTLSASYISSSILTFDTGLAADPTFKAGQVFYSPDTLDLSFHTSITDIKLNIGQQTFVRVKNQTGAQIDKGKLVFISGGVGDNPLINTASWENDVNSARTIGMVMKDVPHNDFTYVILNGVIAGVDTAGYTAGQTLFLSSSGDYTNITPTPPKHTVRIGEVVRQHATVGSIFINIQNGYELTELHDVSASAATNGDLLVYDSATSLWKNGKALSGSYTITNDLTASGVVSGSSAQFTALTSSQEAIYITNNMGISTAGGIAATTKTGSIVVQATDANGLFFHPSGTYMYVADNTTDKVFEYSLSTPWDVSSAAYTSVTASFSAQENTPHDIFFHPSGTYFYILGITGDDINQYSMSPAWSLSSAVFTASSSANGYEGAPLGMWFKPDGTSVYIVGSITNTVRQHSITTPWDITTMVTASVVSSYSAVGAITNGQISGISFSDDGKKMYLISSAAGDRRLYEFILSTAWDLSTVTKYIGHNVANANNTMTATSVLSALYRRPDGSNIYFINNGSVDKVIQYDTKNASLSVGDGILQVNDGLAVFGSSSFGDLMANNIRSSAITTISGIAAGSTLTAGTTISASSTISAGGAITGSAGLNISGGPTTIAGGAGQNMTVSTALVVSGPNANFGATTIVSGSIARFDTVIGKYATYSANFTVATASYFSGINSTGGVITASLSGAASYYAGQTLIFKDIGGNAAINNILIQASGSNTIDINPSYIINTASGSLTLICNGVNGFYVV